MKWNFPVLFAGKLGVDHSVWATMRIFPSAPRPSSPPSERERWRGQGRTAGCPAREYLLTWRNIPFRNISLRATGTSWRNTRDTGTLTRPASSSSTISQQVCFSVSSLYSNLISHLLIISLQVTTKPSIQSYSLSGFSSILRPLTGSRRTAGWSWLIVSPRWEAPWDSSLASVLSAL